MLTRHKFFARGHALIVYSDEQGTHAQFLHSGRTVKNVLLSTDSLSVSVAVSKARKALREYLGLAI